MGNQLTRATFNEDEQRYGQAAIRELISPGSIQYASSEACSLLPHDALKDFPYTVMARQTTEIHKKPYLWSAGQWNWKIFSRKLRRFCHFASVNTAETAITG
ncbi:hypothetical protein RvY_17542 [Ramazzottius varieornatus]|uniref:Uncharacterized protein n=1 Tax=Ramazzottius varieornatus TaxID=947166 RepID=A0A1D1W2G1_RAMVA|nr:hypothetical protein RvY_17542 [Ramazzottius varieornatus]